MFKTFRFQYKLFPTIVLIAAASLVPSFFAHAGANSWSAGNIINDYVFTKTDTMNAGQIQAFLNSKVPVCDTYGTQTSEYGGGTRAQWGQANYGQSTFVCLRNYSEGGRSAAQIIYDTAQKYQINPQVLLVLLQKEQGLVTDTWPLNIQYRTATGYGCPDTAPCDSQYYGLTNQLDWSGKMFRAIINNSPTWYTPYVLGNNFISYSPDSSCGGSTVNIQNRATQALYNYTPYQPNQAALNAGWGTAPCGAYGNRNFYLYFTSWFGSTQVSAPAYYWSSPASTVYTNSARTAPYTSQSPFSVQPGGSAYATLTVVNSGWETWNQSTVFLGTTTPNDRNSLFSDSTWFKPSRIQMQETSVAPGETGTFLIKFTAPQQIGSYRECFNLVAELITWMSNSPYCFNIDVNTAQTLLNTKHSLQPGESVSVGDYLLSPDTHSTLMVRAWGDLTLSSNGPVVWHTNTTGGADRLVMQGDGNLVLYRGNQPLWASGTDGNPGSRVDLQTDGNLVVYSPANQPLWASTTASNPAYNLTILHGIQSGEFVAEQNLQTANRLYKMIMQGDGNLVVYKGNQPLWASGTNGKPGAFLAMQGDGNLVIYYQNKPIWATQTDRNSNSRILMQDDGNLVIYNAANRPVWATGTNNR